MQEVLLLKHIRLDFNLSKFFDLLLITLEHSLFNDLIAFFGLSVFKHAVARFDMLALTLKRKEVMLCLFIL
jgi:hypothetical protein